MANRLTKAQARALEFIAADRGTTHVWALPASRPTREVLARLGLIECRFPGRVSLTTAGRAALDQPVREGDGA